MVSLKEDRRQILVNATLGRAHLKVRI